MNYDLKKIEDLEKKVIDWYNTRIGVTELSRLSQYAKLVEELDEFQKSEELLERNDAVCDMLFVIITLHYLYDIEFLSIIKVVVENPPEIESLDRYIKSFASIVIRQQRQDLVIISLAKITESIFYFMLQYKIDFDDFESVCKMVFARKGKKIGGSFVKESDL